MDYARYIGRIGALAVTLGVGYAVATTPGIALAAPADSGSSSSPPGGSPTSGEGKGTDSPTAGPQSPSESADGASVEGSGVSGDAGEDASGVDAGVVDAGDDAVDVGDGDEEVVSPSGDEDPSTVDEDASLAGGDDDSAGGDVADQRTSSRSAGSHSARSFAAVDTAHDEDSSLSAGLSARPGAQEQKFSIDDATAGAPALRSSIAPSVANAVTTVAPPPLPVTPAPPAALDDILEEPHTFLVAAIAHLVDAVLEPFLAPFAPGSPGEVPLLWTMLAFVRDEFNRIAFPNMTTDPTPSLVEDPNLLVNPGAELGDPALSGYASVSVPGWAATGTPTVIKYGTQRRFPVPTPSPGPVLPGLLAFPGQGDPGSGQQFFGGGPVADSTLTQTVDLSAAADAIDHRAGGVQYELSGDLGGFLIDPSRTKVSVNFLDVNGASLGTGEIKPVTALDRWFVTGFMHRNVVGSVPVGARSAQVVVSFDDQNPVLGNYNNAYADNVSFKVDADGLAPAALTPPESKVGDLDHVFMVYMENKGVGQILGSPNAPYINSLINQYGYASNYYGLTHPSDPNYYPIIGGSDFGFNFNCPSNCFPAGTPNLADRIEAAGMEWAGYMDGGGGYTSPTDRLPFLAFSDIYNDPERVATHLFDISDLEQGLADPATAPNFVWFSADDETNMEGPTDFPVGIFNWVLGFLNPAHQYNVAAGDEFLKGPVETIMESPTWQDPDQRSVIVVTFDEDYNNITTGVGNEGNHIVTVVIPSQGAIDAGMRAGHFVADDHYNHYSLLRTIEDSLGLAPLTNNDKFAYPMNEFWEWPANM